MVQKIRSKKQNDPTELPPWCRPTDGRTFNEIMDREWEELVIRFDKSKNGYVFKTACCEGADVW